MSLRSLISEISLTRLFADRPVTAQAITDILEDAVWAPNHKLREPWRFIHAEGAAKTKLSSLLAAGLHHDLAAALDNAPASLIVTVHTSTDEHVASDDLAAVFCLVRNIQLLGGSQGLGVYPGTGDWSRCRGLNEFADVSTRERIAAILAVGYPAEQASPPTPFVTIKPTIECW